MDYALLVANFSTPDTAAWPRQRLLHECLRAAIRGGQLAPGTRLAASRALSAELGVARNTVLYAYDQLATEGYVVPDRRGTVVAPLRIAGAARPAAAPASLSRRSQRLRPSAPQASLQGGFAPGVPALDEFPVTLWRRLLDRAWRGVDAASLNYGDPAGEPELRQAIADHLRAARGADCVPGQVFITTGTQNGLDLCARAFADAGDKAWIENPGYGGALAAFRAAQLNVIGIPTDEGGIAPQAADWRRHRPRLVYVTPSHQYPTGCVLGLQRRAALIENARAAGALIVEDDYDSEFRHDGPPLPAMQGLAPDAPVVYLGTFSKTMFPALRIGFMVVPAGLAQPLDALLAGSAPQGRIADQRALAEFLRGGHFALHLRRMRRLYRQRRDAMVAALGRHFGNVATIHGGSAGMHLALQFDDSSIDDARVAALALEKGIVAHALSMHATGARANGWNGLLLGYAQVPADEIDAKVAQLAALI
ncbi:PLP-dependent aminotransferase family protein [Massilia sp. R2A-15]|uniref:MocR-like pyridoxine biosynthesis transcription factor PdxR n=1 Tax=Massilia sp. R2A-15 TaxID=3064278 RepID=UPI0027351659|nr:PLP-dependent aminotransferase family protein [Massilia sp. R2A-15]WLI89376.1 PLP-dependent aminotransferase family protein [Massilia sp. R2A-15]